ncbi:MAG: AAA family ATPase [Muribaculaceae bacterium]|nr:AAA family ATPase [Muribaculaceae bacterium]
MTADDLYRIVLEKAKSFGLVAKNDGKTIINPKGNSIIRNNLLDASFAEGKAYFGFVSEDEETTGVYSDFSFVIFPEKELGSLVVALVVGSSGFKNDYQLASLPGLRRTFLKLRTPNSKTFFKTSFENIENAFKDLLKEIRANHPGLKKVIESYSKYISAAQIIKLDDEEEQSLDTIFAWLASYAKVREWGTTDQRKIIADTLNGVAEPSLPDEKTEIIDLLEKRKYVVLQGAPGTGKTWNALEISKRYHKTFFEQFHAETTYSDFVYGLEPNCDAQAGQSQFIQKKGILYKTLEYAEEHWNEKVLLIIDEINRANLSNVLGPIFYLFEYTSNNRQVALSIGNKEFTRLPDNVHVIATMNTADRSLAVVDFALRRRFAWYTLKPHVLASSNFDSKMFKQFADIFFEYATDDELNLQPGQSYFIDKRNMKDRLVYELMPLIKEYLAEGYLLKAKDSFCELFYATTGKLMYE